MTMLASVDLLPTIYATLAPGGAIDTQLASFGFTGVFDWRSVPENQPFDYITIGDVQEIPNNTFGGFGNKANITIHLWSRQAGTKQSGLAVKRIQKLFDEVPLTLPNYKHVSTMFIQAQFIADPDGLTLHTTIRYQIYCEE